GEGTFVLKRGDAQRRRRRPIAQARGDFGVRGGPLCMCASWSQAWPRLVRRSPVLESRPVPIDGLKVWKRTGSSSQSSIHLKRDRLHCGLSVSRWLSHLRTEKNKLPSSAVANPTAEGKDRMSLQTSAGGHRLLAMTVHNIGFLLDRLGQDCHPL